MAQFRDKPRDISNKSRSNSNARRDRNNDPNRSRTNVPRTQILEKQIADNIANKKLYESGGKLAGALSGVPGGSLIGQFGGGLLGSATAGPETGIAGDTSARTVGTGGGTTRPMPPRGDRNNSGSGINSSTGAVMPGQGIGGIVDAQTQAQQQGIDEQVRARDAALLAQTQGRDQGIATQKGQLGTTMGQLQPWQTAGTDALSQQRALLGLGGAGDQEAAFASFAESPGQKFLRDRQEKVLMRNSKAMGGLGGGNVRSALQEQAAGFAAQDYNNQFNRLGGLSSQGLGATTAGGQFGANAANQISGLQSGAASNIGNIETGTAANISNLLTGQGEARASGILAKEQKDAAKTEGIANILGMFSDEIGEGLGAIGGGISDFFTG